MKTNNELRSIDIIYPKSMRKASPIALAMCEGFITKLIQAKHTHVKIKANNKLTLIECNEIAIKNYLDLILKSKRLNEFYIQFIALLHKNSNESIDEAMLTCSEKGRSIEFLVSETDTVPDFSWEIYRCIP